MPSDEENDVAPSPRELANKLASDEYLLLDVLDRCSERAVARGADEALD
jgi:hypothetical protein